MKCPKCGNLSLSYIDKDAGLLACFVCSYSANRHEPSERDLQETAPGIRKRGPLYRGIHL